MKMWLRFRLVALLAVSLCAALALGACGGSKGSAGAESETAKDAQEKAQRELPPLPSEAKDMSLPPVQVSTLDNGLQLNTIATDQLPVVYATLVIRHDEAVERRDRRGDRVPRRRSLG
jgi:ABC-type oligopeptide transport system substrate-binding subunit